MQIPCYYNALVPKMPISDLFEDIDIEQDLRLLQEIFNIDLSDIDAKNIVNPPQAGGNYQ